MKTLKSIVSSPIFWTFIILVACFYILDALHTTPHQYVGRVISVSTWNSHAKLQTKTESGKDTILTVVPRKHEHFVEGQIITVWTGGDLFEGVASTTPQK